MQHDNVAFRFATYLHVKEVACAKQEIGLSVENNGRFFAKESTRFDMTRSCKYLYIFMRHVKLTPSRFTTYELCT